MFHTPDDFLRAIEADPRELTLRLAFADWLTEHDDPRGELIRAEEEMRALPVFADRFWELKPRRNELRAEAGPEWCARMRYGTECEPVFRHGIPDGWRERWRLIREFTERWHRVPMPDVGGRQTEIAKVEARLGRELPPSVREWLAFRSDVLHIPPFSYCLNHDFAMKPLTGQAAFSLYYDSLGEFHSAVRLTEAAVPDPPVEYFIQAFDDAHQPAACTWHPDRYFPTQPVTGWVFGHVFTELPAAGGCFIHDIRDPETFYAALDQQHVTRVQVGNALVAEIDNLLITFHESVDRTRHSAVLIFARRVPNHEMPPVVANFIGDWDPLSKT